MQPQAPSQPVQESHVHGEIGDSPDSPAETETVPLAAVPEQPANGRQPPPGGPATTNQVRRKTDWRHRKAELLPEITQLALEGHSGRSIALRLSVPIRSVVPDIFKTPSGSPRW